MPFFFYYIQYLLIIRQIFHGLILYTINNLYIIVMVANA